MILILFLPSAPMFLYSNVLFKKISNFFSHGFVPNGGRVYYLSRSQPPLLTPMVYEYFLATGDVDFVQQVFFLILFSIKKIFLKVLPALEKEQTFWNLNRARSFLDPETKEELFQYYQYRAAMKFEFFYWVFKIFHFFKDFRDLKAIEKTWKWSKD